MATGTKLYRRKHVQQERSEKLAKRTAALSERRGKISSQQAPKRPTVTVVTEGLLVEAPGTIPVPDSWNCPISDAQTGIFVVLEVEYETPRRNGIAVAQVDNTITHLHYFIALVFLLHEDALHVCTS